MHLASRYSYYYSAGEALPFGELFNDSFDRASLGSDYTSSGVATWACDGSELDTSGGSTLTDRLRRDDLTNSFEDVVIDVTYRMTSAPSSSTLGLGIGWSDHSSPDGESTIYIRMIHNNNSGNVGRVAINRWNGTAATQKAVSSGTAVTIANGESYRVQVYKSIVSGAIRYRAVGTRLANGSSNEVTWSEVLTTTGISNADIGDCTSDFALYSLGGGYAITNWTVTVNDKKNIQNLFVGDSITHGYCADDITDRWATQVGSSLGGAFEISAGTGDGGARVLEKITNIIAYNPTRVFLMLGTNDVANGVADATRKANYQSIVNQLEAEDIQVVLVYNIPRNGVAIAAFNTWINDTFPNNTKIDVYTPLADGANLHATYNIGDNVHPNQAGHDLIASTIIAAL